LPNYCQSDIVEKVNAGMTLSIVTFILGCLVGWTVNHYYSVVVRRPLLVSSGGGGGSSIGGAPFHFVHISVRNELRRLGLHLPPTVILGKALRTDFGNQLLDRDPARQCTAQLFSEEG